MFASGHEEFLTCIGLAWCAVQVNEVPIALEDDPSSLLLAQPGLISRDSHKAGALGLHVARLQLGVLLASKVSN